MASSRIGAILGNILFPVMLESGCLQTFLVFGSTAIGNNSIISSTLTSIIALIAAAGLLSFFAPNLRSDEILK